MSDAVTIIRCSPLLWMTKRIWPRRVEASSKARLFAVASMPVSGLDDVANLLIQLINDPHAAVIRGALIDPANTHRVRRLLHTDQKTGERPIFREQARRWVAFDIEGILRPSSLPAADLIGCALLAIEQLPIAFHGVRCIVQASASHGIKPDIRLRLWFWLARPTGSDELKQWLRGSVGVDLGVISAVQPIYTARPLFVDGAADPLPHRLAELPGTECVQVPPPETLALLPCSKPRLRPLSLVVGARANSLVDAALVASAMRAIPNRDAPYHDFIRWGYAIFAAGGGYEVFQEWSAKSKKHDEAETREYWNRIAATGASRITVASIIAEAKRHGWRPPLPEPPPEWEALHPLQGEPTIPHASGPGTDEARAVRPSGQQDDPADAPPSAANPPPRPGGLRVRIDRFPSRGRGGE
jgi:hypothetical protein